MNVKRWIEILEPVFGAGEMDLAEEIFTTLDAAMSRQHHVSEKVAVRAGTGSGVGSTGHRTPRPLRSRTPTCPSRSWTTSTLAGRGPRRTSVTTSRALASLGHLVRHQDLEFQGPQDLVDLGHRPARPGSPRVGAATVSQPLCRCWPSTAMPACTTRFPEDTWTLAFGWYMHALFGRALRTSVPQEPAADLRLLPLQQARPADT